MAAQLTAWPGLDTGRPSCGVGRGFAFHGTQILHLHTGDEADLRLTRPFIDRLDQVLTESGQIVIRSGDDWVTVRLDTDTAGSLLISLVSLAIQAVEERGAPARPCTRERARRSERSGRLSSVLGRASGTTEAARGASEDGESPEDTERSQGAGRTLAAGAEERSLPRPLRRLRPLRQR
ncbi:hypothetical protein GCM10023196_093530 [Actinoallomurus vinaceus]|uniref:Luciferase domain-containing protein n=1 Tax=Actinoallomurus vinaceus TaxID=1080074 RepID=A0ABP8UT18_9ACTN